MVSFRKHINQLSDEQLVAKYKKEPNAALVGVLYQRYTHLAIGTAMKYIKNKNDAEDAVMQVFEKLLSDLKNKDLKNFKSYLYVMVKNQCLMQLRKTKREFPSDLLNQEQEEPQTKDYEEIEQQLLALEAAIPQLKPEQAQCVQLFYIKKRSYQEIVEITKYDQKKVKSYIQNGKRNLKLILQKK